MSYHRKDPMEHLPYAPQLALRCLSNDALRFGLPFHLDAAAAAAYLEAPPGQRLPYPRLHYLPFHGALGVCDYSFEPAFIRKRNERERHRVRCVNEGYARLREHLPREFEDKRLSKVETLRAAIGYIRRLQGLLDFDAHPGVQERAPEGPRSRAPPQPQPQPVAQTQPMAQRTDCNSDGESKTGFSDGGEALC